MSLASKIRSLREQLGWSQSKLSRVTDIPQPTIWRLERGDIEHPRADTLMALANALRAPIDFLVYDDYEPAPDDLLRTDDDVRSMLQDYTSLPLSARQAVRQLAQSLKPSARTLERRRPVDIAVRSRRVRKE